MKKLTLIYIICLLGILHARAQGAKNKGLKDYYAGYFPIGAAVSAGELKDTGEVALILKQFTSLTPENDMKWGQIHPQEKRYNWKNADSIVAFAQRHGLKVRGHNLCWHENTPAWVFKDSAGDLVIKEVLLKRLKDHITNVVSHILFNNLLSFATI